MAVGSGFRTLWVVGVGLLMVLVSLAPVGCGSSAEPQLSGTAASRLQRGLGDVRREASAEDRASALKALSSFSRLVNRESGAGHLSPADTQALKMGIVQARRRIELELKPPAAPAPAPPTPAPAARESEQGGPKRPGPAEQPKRGKGRGKGKGKR